MTAPLVDTTRGFKLLSIDQVYTGPDGSGAIVPNPGDAVLDWSQGLYRVVSVDTNGTNLSYLQPVNLANLGGGASTDDDSIITGPGTNSTAFRIYVDTSTIPHTLAVDARAVFNGADNAYIRVFYGTDTSNTGRIISAVVDSGGNITSDAIPLQNVVIPNSTNVAVKTPSIASCSETVTDGDVVTVVVYSSAGVVTSRDRFIVSTTNFIPSIDQSTKYVSNIELLSPFISKTDNRLITCPINMVTQSLNYTAKVSYSDGTSAISAIDGVKWNLAGANAYIATQIGQVVDLYLLYTLSSGEQALDATAALPDRVVRKSYRLRTVDVDSYYAVKLFVVPTWNNATNQYDLRWYLYNLARTDVIEVTANIEYATTSPTWVGNSYGGVQNLTVAFNMQNLGGTYGYFRQVQTVAISLLKPVTTIAAGTYYTIGYSATDTYGVGVQAVIANDEQNVGAQKLDLSCGQTDVLSWLAKLYTPSEPLYYSATDATAPTPTHALVLVGDDNNLWQREIPIANILTTIRNITQSIAQGGLIRVKLFVRDAQGDHQLAILPFVATTLS